MIVSQHAYKYYDENYEKQEFIIPPETILYGVKLWENR